MHVYHFLLYHHAQFKKLIYIYKQSQVTLQSQYFNKIILFLTW